MYKVGDMKLLRYILFMSTFAVACMSCHEQEEFDNDPYGNFDALWINVEKYRLGGSGGKVSCAATS